MEEDLKTQKDKLIEVAAILTSGMLHASNSASDAVAKFQQVYEALKKFQY